MRLTVNGDRNPRTAPGRMAVAMAVTTQSMTDEQFEIRDWKVQRCFSYLDPDYAGKDTHRYPWLAQAERSG